MVLLRKVGGGLTALVLCFLLTGFFGGGEKPQDCINAMVKAIDNNDSKSFEERVPLEFWISLSSLMSDEFQSSMKTAMTFMDVPADASKFTSALASAITPSVRHMAQTAQETIRTQIDKGRTGMEKNSPWTSETLSKVTAGEAGTGAEAGTATAVLETDGRKLTLGLAKINDKWILLGVGGNKKSALDITLVLKKQKEQRAAEVAHRRKGNEQWLKEFDPIFEKAIKLDREKWRSLINESIPSELYTEATNRRLLFYRPITLESPELWNAVTNIFMEGMRSAEFITTTEILGLLGADYKNCLSEVVFQKGDVLITKSLFKNRSPDLTEYEQWLSGELDEAEFYTVYTCFIKKDRRWTLVAFTMSSPKELVYTYLGEYNVSDPDFKQFPFTHVEYLAEFAKRYPDLKKKAEQILASEQGWKDSLQTAMKNVGEAVTAKNSKALGALVDVSRLLRNRDSVEATALWRLNKTENDADIQAFTQEIDKGALTPDNPLNGLNLATATVKSVTETQGVAAAGSQFLLFERVKVADPWKLVRVVSKEETLHLPADWEKNVETLLARERTARAENATKIAALTEQLKQRFTVELPNALDKKTPDAVLPLLNLQTLALCPRLDCTNEQRILLANQVAPLGAYTRALNEAVRNGKPLPGLEEMGGAAALRKAELVLDSEGLMPSKGRLTIATPKGTRSLIIYETKAPSGNATVWTLASAPLSADAAAPTREAYVLGQQFSAPEPYTPRFAALGTLLAEKKGKEFVEFLDMAALRFWNPRRGYSWNDNTGLGMATVFPEALQPQRQAISDSIAANGTCTINGVKVTAELLEQAMLNMAGKGVYSITLPDGVLWFVLTSENKLRLVSTIANLPEDTSKDLLNGYNGYVAIQKMSAEYKDNFIQTAALQTCIDEILKTVQISNPQLTAKQTDNDYITVEIQAEVRNTGKQPCEMSELLVVFKDADQNPVWSFTLEIKEQTLQPNRPVRVSWATGLRSETFYWVQQVHAGKASIELMPNAITIEKTQYSYDSSSAKKQLRNNADGTWQMGTFPAVKPRPAMKGLPSNAEEAAALKDRLQQQMNEENQKLTQARETFLKQFRVKFNPTSATISIRNHMENKVYVNYILCETIEKGVVTGSKEIGGFGTVEPSAVVTSKVQIPAVAGSTVECTVTSVDALGMTVRADRPELYSGVVPPLLYQDSPVLFTLTEAQMAGTAKAEAPKPAAPAETPKADASKAETPAEAPKAEAAKPATSAEAPKADAATDAPKAKAPTTGVTASGTATASGTPTPPEGKNSGKAVLGTTTMDLVGLSAFGSDGKPDSAIRVSLVNPSPLVAVRIDNIGGTMASWKTKEAKTSAKGVIAVVRDGKLLNADNAAFSLDVTTPVVLDLLVQDTTAAGGTATGVIAESKTRLRVVFHHQDGKRSYSILEPAK